MINATVNGIPLAFPAGLSVLQALHGAGIAVPSACADDRAPAHANCRLCMVRINGQERAVPACATPLEAGMAIETHPDDIEHYRKTLLTLLARDLSREALEKHPDKAVHRLIKQYGLEDAMQGASAAPTSGPIRLPADETHPYIRVDLSQCISCYRCVNACQASQGVSVWHVRGHGDNLRVLPDSGTTLLASSCTSCGACAQACPTGALTDRSVPDGASAPTEWTRTTCPYCGVGCQMEVGVRAGRIVQVLPAMDAPVNKGHLCVKGRYAHGFVHAPDRATEPMLRDKLAGGHGPWRTVSWDEAIAHIPTKLRLLIAEYGPDSIGVLGSARATNEENYLAQKFARLVVGTHNVDGCARVCHAPTAAAMQAMLGTGAATNSFDDIERAKSFLVCGANATENHPIVGKRILKSVLAGAPMVVIDPRRTELAEHATLHLALRPGTNVPLFNAIACAIIEEGLADADALRDRVEGWQEFKTFIADFAPEKVAPICGVEAQLVRQAARLYATSKPAMCFHGLGMTEHVQGTEGVMAMINLALLTGNFGKPGSGVNPLRGQNNVQGAGHMGCKPDRLTGGVSLEEGRGLFTAVWGAPLPTNKGLNLMEMVDAAGAGKLKALWAIGYDIALTHPDTARTGGALDKLDLVIVQDLFLSGLAKRHGTVFLPAVSSFEKDGTFMNSERRIQRVRRAIAPLGHAKADWEIIRQVAQAMGHGGQFPYGSAEDIWEEIRRVWKAGAGIAYARLEGGGLQWPCPGEGHPGTAILHQGAFPHGPRARLRPIAFTPTAETTDADFPLLLVTGRSLYQFNVGSMTGRTPNAQLRPTDTLDLHAGDAARIGLRNGQRVRLCSRHGATELPVRISGQVKPGEVFATFQDPEVGLNLVTGPHRDGVTGTPEYKVTAVRLEPV